MFFNQGFESQNVSICTKLLLSQWYWILDIDVFQLGENQIYIYIHIYNIYIFIFEKKKTIRFCLFVEPLKIDWWGRDCPSGRLRDYKQSNNLSCNTFDGRNPALVDI